MTIKRCYSVLVGASVVENQLVKTRETSASQTVRGITVTDNRDGSFTLNGTVSETGNIDIVERIPLSNGHKYAVLVGSNVSFTDSQSYSTTKGNRLLNATSSTKRTFNLYVISGNTFTNYLIYPQCVDLTAELGTSIADYIYSLETATAGSGIAKLREWGFLRGYQAYNAGSIESVEVTGKKVVGFNQWDEVAETGTYNLDTGTPISTSSYFRTKNPIKALPNTTYHIASGGDAVYVFFYGADDNYLGYRTFSGQSNIDFTTAINCYYIRFVDVTRNVYDPSVKPICINLSNPDRNGEYEAYASQSYALGSDTLRGIFKLDANNQLYADGDRKEADGTVTRRYGIVDLGTLNWAYHSATYQFRAALPQLPKDYKPSETPNAICTKYIAHTHAALSNGQMSIFYASVNGVNIIDSAYTDADTFKAAMSGVMLVYELATPTTETSTPFTSPQVCYPDGTEEFVTSNGVPVGHETKYQL